MPIDASIPLQAKGVQFDSPINQLALMGEATKLGEMNRGIQEQNRLNEYLKGADLSSPATRQELMKYGKTGLAYGKALAEQEKLGLETKKLTSEVDKNQYEQFKQRTADLIFNPSDSNVKAHLEDGVLKGMITPVQAQERWSMVSRMNPDQRKQYFTDMGMKAQERAQLAETTRSHKVNEGISSGHLQIARENQQRGTIPAGYRMTPDGQLEAIPGGPTTTPLAPKELQAREAKYPMATQAVKTVESKADKLATDLRTLQSHPGLDEITGVAGGRLPGFTSAGREAKSLYDSIVARGGFQELSAMRAASPTGGALGNVSNQEGQQLKDAFAAISRTQDASSLRTQLKRAEEDVIGAKGRVREAYDMTYDYKAGAPSAATPATGGKADPLGIR
jgi:hypothetical protein